jgi:lipopolysaccharide biosynthesis regulator YciM
LPVAGLYLAISKTYKNNFLANTLLTLGFCFFIYKTNEVSNGWRSDKLLWLMAEETQETPKVLSGLSSEYLRDNEFQKSYNYADRLWQWNPDFENADLLYARSIYKLSNLNSVQKNSLLSSALKQKSNSIWIKYYMATLEASQGHWESAHEIMNTVEINSFNNFKDDISIVIAEVEYFCLQAAKPGCNENSAKIKNHQKLIFNEEKYKQRINQLINK